MREPSEGTSGGDFLRGEKKAEFLPFGEARARMRASDINTQAEFKEASREGRLTVGFQTILWTSTSALAQIFVVGVAERLDLEGCSSCFSPIQFPG